MSIKFKYNFTSILAIAVAFEVVFWPIFFFIWYQLGENPDFRFENQSLLWGFLAIPILLGTYLLLINWKNKAISRFGTQGLLKYVITSGVSTPKSIVRFLLVRNAVFCLILALANPQYRDAITRTADEDAEVTGSYEGIDIMLALDVSNSMLARDIQNRSRLDVAKLAIKRLINNLKGDNIGLVVFAGKSYTQLPITSDYAAAKLFLDAVSTRMMSAQGTAIGSAIDKAAGSFDYENGINKTIIVISDGENHEGDAAAATKRAVENGIIVHTVGIGSSKGSPIPIMSNGQPTGKVKRDRDGNTVLTRLNEKMLKEIAKGGNGSYILAKNMNTDLAQLKVAIDKTEKKEFEIEDQTNKGDEFKADEEKFALFLLIGFSLLVLELLISMIDISVTQRIKLFES
jgi:Ca-activated chloride channel family protein